MGLSLIRSVIYNGTSKVWMLLWFAIPQHIVLVVKGPILTLGP